MIADAIARLDAACGETRWWEIQRAPKSAIDEAREEGETWRRFMVVVSDPTLYAPLAQFESDDLEQCINGALQMLVDAS